MDLRGKPEITVESRRLREPVRYQKGAYDGMHDEWSYYIRQLGWHRRSISFCPCNSRGKGFFCTLKNN